jgi:hypothetical protein
VSGEGGPLLLILINALRMFSETGTFVDKEEEIGNVSVRALVVI